MKPAASVLAFVFAAAHLGCDAPSSTPKVPTPPTPTLSETLDRTADAFLRRLPASARVLGLHEFDGKVSAASQDAAHAWIKELQELDKSLATLEKMGAAKTDDEKLDLAMARREVALQLFSYIDMEDWKRKPAFYEDLFGVNAYIDRDYAPLDERARALLAHEKAALAELPHVKANIQGPLSRPIVETAIKIYRGYAEYLRKDVPLALAAVTDTALMEDFKTTNEALAKEAEALAGHLALELNNASETSHQLGEERYKKLLATQEGLSIPLQEFRKMAQSDLDRNRTAYEALFSKVKRTRPKKEKLLSEATALMDSSRAFVIEKNIVTIPFEDTAELKESPPYMRWNSAFLDSSGPYEKAHRAFYYVTMPDPKWAKKEQEEYIMSRGTLLSTTVHEVYPGHFLQGQWLRRAPTKIQKMMGSYSFVEGWAHYTEELMIEQGFGSARANESRLGQLEDALLRNCRWVASIQIHVDGTPQADIERLFREQCHQDAATAREQAIRGTFDPGYFAYTLGKRQILDLRAKAQELLGDKFSLHRFHDELLSHGEPVLPLVEARVLEALQKSP